MQKTRPALFRHRHFEDHVIVLYVRWYLRLPHVARSGRDDDASAQTTKEAPNIVTSPISYPVDGRQHVAIASQSAISQFALP